MNIIVPKKTNKDKLFLNKEGMLTIKEKLSSIKNIIKL